jgi:hypothetical protein
MYIVTVGLVLSVCVSGPADIIPSFIHKAVLVILCTCRSSFYLFHQTGQEIVVQLGIGQNISCTYLWGLYQIKTQGLPCISIF